MVWWRGAFRSSRVGPGKKFAARSGTPSVELAEGPGIKTVGAPTPADAGLGRRLGFPE